MTKMRMGKRARIAVAGASAMALLLAGCGSGDEGDATTDTNTTTNTATESAQESAQDGTTDSETAAAETSTAADTATETAAAGECAPATVAVEEAGGADGGPTFGVPLPDGWNRVGEFESDMIPLALANQGLSADGFTPTAVLTIEPSQVGGEQEFDRQLAMVEQLGRPGTVTEREPGTTCGHESQVIEYEMEGPNGIVTAVTALIVSVPVADGFMTAVLSAQSADADNADYAEGLRTMVDEFQVKS